MPCQNKGNHTKPKKVSGTMNLMNTILKISDSIDVAYRARVSRSVLAYQADMIGRVEGWGGGKKNYSIRAMMRRVPFLT